MPSRGRAPRAALGRDRHGGQQLEQRRSSWPAAASGRAAELARLRYEEGAGDFLEVLDSERRLLEAEDRLAAGRAEAAGALVAVYRASGSTVAGRVGR